MTSHLDELAKGMASGMSRRRALKLFGTGLLGSAAAVVLPSAATAAKGRNDACAQFCNSVFGAGTSQADACISDAAHSRGLCYECGPKSDGTKIICGTVCCTSDCCVVANGGGLICLC